MSAERAIRSFQGWWLPLCSFIVWTTFAACPCAAAAPADDADPLPEPLSLAGAVQWALEHNPELATIRAQHGIAAAGIVIAQTYPFNPIWEAKVRGVSGPESAGITNRVSNEHKVFLEVELHHQGRFRRDGAAAALSRTDWEIAWQEVGVAVRIIRAFDTLLYRQEKLRLIEQTVQLNEETAKQVAKLVEQAQLRAGDLIVARTEVDDARAQFGIARAAVVVARSEFRRGLGVVDGALQLQGTMETTLPIRDANELTLAALERRADLQARIAAVSEAEARLRLTQADRFGNPVVGPAYEYDPTRDSLIGAQFALPLPVFNRRKGEIMQREAERARALQELRQIEIQIRQDIDAALARLKEAQAWTDAYRAQTLPNLRKALEEMNRLFAQNQPGSDVLRVIDIRRKLLKAQEGYLDALWELSQGRADLASALGDPTVLLCPTGAPPDAKENAPPE